MKIRSLICQMMLLGALLTSEMAAAEPFPIGDATCLSDGTCGGTAELSDPDLAGDLTQASRDAATPERTFLFTHQKRYVGIPNFSVDESRIVDYTEQPEDASNAPVWDAYGTGAYYTDFAPRLLANQVWHVDFTTQEHKQITDGHCIPGPAIENVTRDWVCGYNPEVAASPGLLAFFQQTLTKDRSAIDEEGHITVHEEWGWQLITVVGGEASAVITLGEHPPDHLSWSPDGKWLLFVDEGELSALKVGTTQKCVLPKVSQHRVTHPEWSGLNGGTIVYEAAGNIWTVPIKANKPKGCPDLQLNRQQQLTSGGVYDSNPQWLEIGDLISFLSTRPMDPSEKTPPRRIWTVKADGTGMTATVTLPFSIKYADWQTSTRDRKTTDILGAKGAGARK